MKCQVNKDFDRCVECVYLSRKYDLIIFNVEWKWVCKKKARLCTELSKTFIKITHLQK